MQELSISIQTFKRLREDNRLYVDKTEYVYKVMNLGGAKFLARPRRFGKSLFLSTIMELAEGNRALFAGTWIDDKWDWTRKYPVLHFPFAMMGYQDSGLKQAIFLVLERYYNNYNIEVKTDDIKVLFADLIFYLYKNYGKVVILIDEYDKPLLDYVEQFEVAKVEENQRILKHFYSVLKDAEPYLHLTFITGIAKFAKVSIFSDLNHLDDLTFNRSLATAYGYTQTEIETYFGDFFQAFLDENEGYTMESLLAEVKEWYNGYSWDGKTSVYNPFGILHFFQHLRFTGSWFDSGTPTLLVKNIFYQQDFKIEGRKINLQDNHLPLYQDIDNIILLFQSGYLTVKSMDSHSNVVLDFPNRDVREAFYRFLLGMAKAKSKKHREPMFMLSDAFRADDMAMAERLVRNAFDDLPYDVYTNQTPEQVEGFYHGIIHVLFNYLGLYTLSEVHTTEGRADSVVFTDTHIFVFEFKINQTATAALQQIINKHYAQKYENSGKIVVCIGANFDTKTKTMERWATSPAL